MHHKCINAPALFRSASQHAFYAVWAPFCVGRAQKQAQVFSSLELCPSLRVVAITKQVGRTPLSAQFPYPSSDPLRNPVLRILGWLVPVL